MSRPSEPNELIELPDAPDELRWPQAVEMSLDDNGDLLRRSAGVGFMVYIFGVLTASIMTYNEGGINIGTDFTMFWWFALGALIVVFSAIFLFFFLRIWWVSSRMLIRARIEQSKHKRLVKSLAANANTSGGLELQELNEHESSGALSSAAADGSVSIIDPADG